MVRGGLADALDRGAKISGVLTTDYLAVTDADALARLLDLAEEWPEAVTTRVFHGSGGSASIPRRTCSRPLTAARRPHSWAATT